jgi:hypothetical protein
MNAQQIWILGQISHSAQTFFGCVYAPAALLAINSPWLTLFPCIPTTIGMQQSLLVQASHRHHRASGQPRAAV